MLWRVSYTADRKVSSIVQRLNAHISLTDHIHIVSWNHGLRRHNNILLGLRVAAAGDRVIGGNEKRVDHVFSEESLFIFLFRGDYVLS